MKIGKKLTFWTVFVVLVTGLISTFFFFRIEISNETTRLESLGTMVGRVVEESLDNYMLVRDFTVLDKALRDLREVNSIRSISVINREGFVKISTDKQTVGRRLMRTGPECTGCHETGKKGLYFRKDKIFRWVQPIRNKPECFGCHSPAVRNNGIFLIEFSLLDWEKEVKNEALIGFSVLVPSLAVIGFMMLSLSKNLVIKRLTRINERVAEFREGNYQVRMSPDKADDEITELEKGFNEMAKAISTRDSEKSNLLGEINSVNEQLRREITEREQAENDLQISLGKVSRSQRIWQETFDSIGDMISILDNDFNVIKVNRSFAEYFNLDPQEVLNRKCYDFFHGTDAPIAGCPYPEAVDKSRPATSEVLDPKTGKIFLISIFPFHMQAVGFSGVVHIAKDVTEEREKEMKLIMSERLASLGQMASGIAHEINNPLAAIAGCAEGLLNRVEKERYNSELFRNYLKIIEEEILRCKSITTSMLSFVRQTTYEKKLVDINDILEKTLEIIGFQGRLRDVKVLKEYLQGIPPVHGSEGELRQVFLAIISNALDAMKNKGTLTLRTEKRGNDLLVSVRDTGPGIPQEHINRIFDPFFTSKSQTGGTGLGLSIAAKIVSNHGGKIDVFSEHDKGAVFTVTLPLSEQ